MSTKRKGTARAKPLQSYAPVFAALGEEVRIRLIAALCVDFALSITQLTRRSGALKAGKLLYNPRAPPIRFVKVPGIGLKDYVWRCNLLIYKAPVAQPDRAPAF